MTKLELLFSLTQSIGKLNTELIEHHLHDYGDTGLIENDDTFNTFYSLMLVSVETYNREVNEDGKPLYLDIPLRLIQISFLNGLHNQMYNCTK